VFFLFGSSGYLNSIYLEWYIDQKVKTSIHIIFLLSVFATLTCFAQQPHPAFRQYTTEDGLASSEVYQVKQDSKGYIWFATGNGVSRFNGYEFENFSVTNGLPDNTVFEIFEDSKGRIWFLPISCKLSYYYQGKIHLFKYNEQLQKIIKNPLKTSFCVDEEGTVFLGLAHDGIYRITADGKITHFYDKETTSAGLWITEPVKGTFVYSNSSFKQNKKAHFNTSTLKGYLNLSIDVAGIPVNARMIRTKSNKILISYFDMLIIIDNLNEYRIEKLPGKINWIYEDRDGDLWLGAYLGGVYHVQGEDFSRISNYLEDISVDGIIQDAEGGFWIATEGSAVFYTPSKRILNFNKMSGLADNRATSLTAAPNSLYVGLQNGFIHKIGNDGSNTATDCNMKGEPLNGISSMFYDKRQDLVWVAGNLSSGILRNNKFIEQRKVCLFNRMLLDSNRLWFATATGLEKLEDGKSTVIEFDNHRKINRINAIALDSQKHLFLGAMNGLWRFNGKDKAEYLGNKDSLLAQRILDLAFTENGIMAIATKGSGLLLYDQNQLVQISTSNGLCGDNVYRISLANDTIWVATNKGINRVIVSKGDLSKFKIQSYTSSDGLVANEVNDIINHNGLVWAATNKGLSFFKPSEVIKENVSLPVYVTGIMINGNDTALLPNYDLAYDQNNIKIAFQGLGFKDAGKLRYRYKMVGINADWVYSNNREAQFTTLPANKYTFLVSVMNADGQWSSREAKVNFTIKAPLWQEWWFKSLCWLFIIGMIALLLRYRLRKRQEEDERNVGLYKLLVKLKLKALRAQMNPHFTFNVMNSIQHFIVNKDEESALRYLSKFSKLVRAILNNSEKNGVTVKEELEVIRLYLELEAMRFEKRFDYEIIVDPEIEEGTVEIPSMLIQPYIENAVKHGILPLTSTGKITVEIKKQEKFIRCVIEDNGIGREKAAENRGSSEHKSFGTAITQERLAVINTLYNSTLSEKIIDLYGPDGKPAGTRVEIYIPYE
jgi:ligand-binding sensor domain-containing protein